MMKDKLIPGFHEVKCVWPPLSSLHIISVCIEIIVNVVRNAPFPYLTKTHSSDIYFLPKILKKCISNCLWEHKQMYKFYNYYLQSSLDNLKKNVYKANVCSNYENRLTTG